MSAMIVGYIPTIVRSVEKTGRLVVVNEGALTGGFTAEVAARVQREAFDWLDAPIMQVATEDVPLPYNGRLELEAIPSVEDIIKAAKDALYWDPGHHDRSIQWP